MNSTADGFSKGYLSEEHKRKFTITAGILGGVFFIGQFIVPVIIFIIAMPLTIFQKGFFKSVELESAELWEGAIWYVESTFGFQDTQDRHVLKQIMLNSEQEPKEIAVLSGEKIWLLGSTDRLWIISSKEVGWYKDGEVSTMSTTSHPGNFERPFLYDGDPAIIEDTPDYHQLLVLRDNEWQVEHRIFLGGESITPSYSIQGVRVVAVNGKHYVFMRYGDVLYCRPGLPITENDTVVWEAIGNNVAGFCPAYIEGKLVAFMLGYAPGRMTVVARGVVQTQGRSRWQEFYTVEMPLTPSIAVFPMEGMRYIIGTQMLLPSGVMLRYMNWDTLEKEMHYGQRSIFPPSLMAFMFIPYVGNILAPILLALIFTSLMRKHKVTEFQSGDTRVPFASLIKRALAQIVDALIIGIPFIIGYATMFSWMFDSTRMFTSQMFGVLWVWFIGIGWAIVCFFVFSYLEGVYGRTPGKWIMKIQVLGTDLSPCGFGRALVRNVLTFVDGFFNFMVGVMIVALNENWQRVGDMAARTVVLETKSK